MKKKKKKEQNSEIKRPQKYLTEKAFYMSQRIRDKNKNENRILRKRPKNKLKKRENFLEE